MKAIIITLLCFLQISIFSQYDNQEQIRKQILSKTDTTILRQLSLQFSNRYQINKEQLIEWSLRTGYPIRTKSSDGKSSLLRGFKNNSAYIILLNK